MIGNNYLIQDTLSDTNAILQRIKHELSQSKQEILVAMAWFTDDELFDILIDKANQGVVVSVIVADHSDNEKLNFDLLNHIPTGEVIKIKNVGYGMMHQKFCIIDRKIVINGSYNWSKNAKNNHENVIVTNLSKTVDEFLETFFKIKNRSIQLMNGASLEEIEKLEELQSKKEYQAMTQEKTISFHEQSIKEFKEVLDNIIASEVGSLDKELIRSSAYNRAKENNGDHQVLSQAMDSLYSNFLNEIEVVAEKKTRLKSKIDEQVKIGITNLELKTENEINSLKEIHALEQKKLEEEILLKEKEIENAKANIESNKNTKIPFLQNQIEKVKQAINDHKIDFVKPPINWPKSIILFSLFFLLLAYLCVFYSSVAYIFIFSKQDMQEMLDNNDFSEIPEVFNPHAISNIWHKGEGGILFLFLFVAIPIALGMFEFITSSVSNSESSQKEEKLSGMKKILKFFNNLGGIILIFIVDLFIAYKVAKNINEMEFLTRKKETEASVLEIIFSTNFLLVFVLGTLGVYLFSKVFNSWIDSLNKRNETFHQAVTKQKIDNLEREIDKLETDKLRLNEENDKLTACISNFEFELTRLRQSYNQAPIILAEKIKDLKQLLNTCSEKLLNLSNIYKSQIDNDKLPISKSELENRCNIFMEGWSKYLYEYFSIQIAEAKTKEAIDEIENWLTSLQFYSQSSSELMLSTLTASKAN